MAVNYTNEDLQNHNALAVVVRDDAGHIVMLNHRKFGFWTIPLGKSLPGQSISDGVVMEMAEELGIIVQKTNMIDVRDLRYKRRGKNVNVKLHLVEVLEYSGKITNKEPGKHSQIKFMNIQDIAKLGVTSDGTLLFLETEGMVSLAGWAGVKRTY